jgi:hypothetical protein
LRECAIASPIPRFPPVTSAMDVDVSSMRANLPVTYP